MMIIITDANDDGKDNNNYKETNCNNRTVI